LSVNPDIWDRRDQQNLKVLAKVIDKIVGFTMGNKIESFGHREINKIVGFTMEKIGLSYKEDTGNN
jgi:hypothetical protein